MEFEVHIALTDKTATDDTLIAGVTGALDDLSACFADPVDPTTGFVVVCAKQSADSVVEAMSSALSKLRSAGFNVEPLHLEGGTK